ncbi:hypothetical protein BKA70DRAFT_1421132 [Coprinopsis sp. MPI-PUGE-AT-0042]|nr:hypothetical protein BKA70DRAFT_1421132 [Coprinopsis sp. MPI-PUGE-AT-0042]
MNSDSTSLSPPPFDFSHYTCSTASLPLSHSVKIEHWDSTIPASPVAPKRSSQPRPARKSLIKQPVISAKPKERFHLEFAALESCIQSEDGRLDEVWRRSLALKPLASALPTEEKPIAWKQTWPSWKWLFFAPKSVVAYYMAISKSKVEREQRAATWRHFKEDVFMCYLYGPEALEQRIARLLGNPFPEAIRLHEVLGQKAEALPEYNREHDAPLVPTEFAEKAAKSLIKGWKFERKHLISEAEHSEILKNASYKTFSILGEEFSFLLYYNQNST